MLDHFRMFAAYNEWANATLYAAAADLTQAELNADCGAFFGSLIATLNHILVADRIWMHRFTGGGEASGRLDAILYPDLPALAAARASEDVRIRGWIDGLTEDDLNRDITFTTLVKPEPLTHRLGPAIAHMFNHQTHHRGQCHAILTSLGKPSLTLDLFYFQRVEAGRHLARL
jgi:uncharacterized damage-inducible protein DinB